jgi:C4-dicarboxylate transporter, DctQ subunit
MAWHERLEEGLIALLLALMTLVTFAQVVARYAFNYSFVWALELTTMLFGWLIFLGMSYGVRVGAHIGVDAIVKSLGPRAARVTAGVAAVLCLVYAIIILVGGWTYVQKMYSIGIEMQDMPIPQWVPRIVLPLGFALLAFRFGQVLYKLVRGKEVHLIGDEAEEALKLRADVDPPRPEHK